MAENPYNRTAKCRHCGELNPGVYHRLKKCQYCGRPQAWYYSDEWHQFKQTRLAPILALLGNGVLILLALAFVALCFYGVFLLFSSPGGLPPWVPKS